MRNERITIKVSDAEKKMLEEAAAKSYRCVADYVRGIVLVEAERVIAAKAEN